MPSNSAGFESLTMKKRTGLGIFISVPFPICRISQEGTCTFLPPLSPVPTWRLRVIAAKLTWGGRHLVLSLLTLLCSWYSLRTQCHLFSPLSLCFRWRIPGTHGKISKTTRLSHTGNVSIYSWSPCPRLAMGMFTQKPRLGASSWSSSSSGDW